MGGPEFGKTCLYNTCTLPYFVFHIPIPVNSKLWLSQASRYSSSHSWLSMQPLLVFELFFAWMVRSSIIRIFSNRFVPIPVSDWKSLQNITKLHVNHELLFKLQLFRLSSMKQFRPGDKDLFKIVAIYWSRPELSFILRNINYKFLCSMPYSIKDFLGWMDIVTKHI